MMGAAANRVADSLVLCIGDATGGRAGRRGSQKRLDEYRRRGVWAPASHSGGRYMRQIARSGEPLAAWFGTPGQAPEAVEANLLNEFVVAPDRRPFTNLKRGTRTNRGQS